jgi:hypothetical protein
MGNTQTRSIRSKHKHTKHMHGGVHTYETVKFSDRDFIHSGRRNKSGSYNKLERGKKVSTARKAIKVGTVKRRIQKLKNQ